MKLSTVLTGLVGIAISLMPEADLREATDAGLLNVLKEVCDAGKHIEFNSTTVTVDMTVAGVNFVNTTVITPNDQGVASFLAAVAENVDKLPTETKDAIISKLGGR